MHVGVVRTYRSKLVAPLDDRASNLLYIQASWHTRGEILRHRNLYTKYVYTAQIAQQETIYFNSDIGHGLGYELVSYRIRPMYERR